MHNSGRIRIVPGVEAGLETKHGNHLWQEGVQRMKKCDDCKKDRMIDLSKLSELIKKKEEPVEEKKCKACKILVIVGIVLAVAGIAFALYKYFKKWKYSRK